MRNTVSIIIAVLLLAACGQQEEKDHGMHHHHHHEGIEITGPVPTVDLIVHKDPKSGYNLQMNITNFTFAPERASTDHVEGEGHAHVYVDEQKIGRVYSSWYHLDVSLAPGKHSIKVNLNGNDHQPLLQNGEPIEDTEAIIVE